MSNAGLGNTGQKLYSDWLAAPVCLETKSDLKVGTFEEVNRFAEDQISVK